MNLTDGRTIEFDIPGLRPPAEACRAQQIIVLPQRDFSQPVRLIATWTEALLRYVHEAGCVSIGARPSPLLAPLPYLLVAHVWPQARPSALLMGFTHYMWPADVPAFDLWCEMIATAQLPSQDLRGLRVRSARRRHTRALVWPEVFKSTASGMFRMGAACVRFD